MLTCLRFVAPTGASLCVDVESLSAAMLGGQWGSPRMLMCLACEDEVAVSLLDAKLLKQPEFTSKLYDLYRTAAEDRDNLCYAARKGYREIDVIERPQGREEPACVVPWVLGLNEVRIAPLMT